MGLFKNLFDYETKELKKINKLVDSIEELDSENLKQRLKNLKRDWKMDKL